MIIISDEFGRYWVVTEDYNPVSGPYDTVDDAESAHPDAEWDGR